MKWAPPQISEVLVHSKESRHKTVTCLMQRAITKYSTRINRNAWNPRSMPPTPPAPTQHRDHHFSHTHKKTFQPIGASNHQLESYGKTKFGNNRPWWKRGSLEEIFNNPSSHFLLLLFLHSCWRSQKPITPILSTSYKNELMVDLTMTKPKTKK
jgi:hypothetical protein